MNRFLTPTFLLLVLAAVSFTAVARSSGAQTPDGMTLGQYNTYYERVVAFCEYYEEQKKNNRPLPKDGDFMLPRAPLKFKASEWQALIPKCTEILAKARKARG